MGAAWNLKLGAIVDRVGINSTMMQWGIAMKVSFGRISLVAALSLLLVGTGGCGTKWLQADGDTASTAEKDGKKSDNSKSASEGAGSLENPQSAGSEMETTGLASAGPGGTTGSNSEGTPGGDYGSQRDGQGVNPAFPETAEKLPGNDLKGFSQSPNEERLSADGGIASVSPTNSEANQYAELTKEERAAIEAGLKDVFFGYDQWTLSEAGMEALNRDAAWLKEHPGAVLKIEGHCDERGTSAYNMVLGDKRSKSARKYLVELGVSQKQVKIISYGKERPFCMERTESCYQLNRRGHVLLHVKN